MLGPDEQALFSKFYRQAKQRTTSFHERLLVEKSVLLFDRLIADEQEEDQGDAYQEEFPFSESHGRATCQRRNSSGFMGTHTDRDKVSPRRCIDESRILLSSSGLELADLNKSHKALSPDKMPRTCSPTTIPTRSRYGASDLAERMFCDRLHPASSILLNSITITTRHILPPPQPPASSPPTSIFHKL